MIVRLGFSVAAHLEPEILLVDEVLAVGDLDFQKKCINKMEDVGKVGRTVLFVSHNMQAVTRLCSRAILLDQGQIKADGQASDVVAKYMTSGSGLTSERFWKEPDQAPGDKIARLRAVRVKDEKNRVLQHFDICKPIIIEMEYDVLQPGYKLLPHHTLFNEEGTRVFEIVDTDPDWKGRKRPAGRYLCSATIPGNMLQEGIIYIQSGLLTLEPQIWQFDERDVVSFQIVDSLDGNTARGEWAGSLLGVVRPLLKWTNEYEKQKF
jgi:lipopolysaccharide transport system ATP-binding protein